MTLSGRLLIFVAFIIGTIGANSQDIAIGEWKDHLPYNKVISMAEVGSRIYAATPYDLFYYDRDDNSIQRISKVNGLSDVGLSSIAYYPDNDVIIITYDNTNIDLMYSNRVVNISDIKRKPILGDKTIHKLTLREHYAYLACGFGIVVLDLDREEIFDTYYIGPDGSQINVYDITFDDSGNIYAATESGIYRASLDSPNLADFAYWDKDSSMILPDASYNFISYFAGKLFTNNVNPGYAEDTLFVHNGTGWDYYNKSNTSTRAALKTQNGHLLIANFSNVMVFDNTLEQVYFTYSPSEIGIRPEDAILLDNGEVWIGDYENGLVRTWADGWSGEIILPNGPFVIDVFDMSSSGTEVWMVPGGRDGSWGNIWKAPSISYLSDGFWHTINRNNVDYLDDIRDVLAVCVDPFDPSRAYVGTWGFGLLEFRDGSLENHFTQENSSLQPYAEGAGVKAGGLCFDSNHNLWVTNSNAGSILSVLKNDGDWKAYNLGSIATGIDMGGLVIDQWNQKWMLVRDHSLIVFNDNNTLDNTSDDRQKKLSSSSGNGNLPGLKILSLAVDNDGELWLGTDEGVAVIYSPENVFSGGNYDAQQILVEVGGYYQYLLETESVNAIAVDGANRKWFGTEKAGVFLMSEDGTEEIYHFTEENSPLLSNTITSIAIDKDGMVYFGTAQGVVSYRSEAIDPPSTNEDVYTFPNPVPPGYSGLIAVKGLVGNAWVKITDISGNLVYETRAEGGQAVWNGRTINGDNVHSGVYMVFITNDDGSETEVTKILFID